MGARVDASGTGFYTRGGATPVAHRTNFGLLPEGSPAQAMCARPGGVLSRRSADTIGPEAELRGNPGLDSQKRRRPDGGSLRWKRWAAGANFL